ncbi:MAG TPA: SusC/RagA family TonB-linked outer membrane protein [Prevotella sp.]|mgnify:CR=1 FL=1|nr:SusC/RagA family TonB-linked outer membrane protein [Prevotella sp.]
MDKNKLIKDTFLPVAVVCSVLSFNPYGVLKVRAGIQVTQQANGLKGFIVDDHGEPVIGATVTVVGSKGLGGVTDMDGNFVLDVKPGTQLKISYIGFDNKIVSARNGMKIVMTSSSAVNLNGVEVVAYGVQKKVTVTGALSSVKGEDLVRTPVTSVNNILAGQLSGVTTVQYSGEPGSDAADIFIRGKGTWDSYSPLIQVDGVERSMSDIDPNEIESITVLKDASATAVFGVRGANGVVLITTKRGKEGKTRISGSTSFSILAPTKMVEQASSYEYATFYNQMRANDGQNPEFSETILNHFKSGDDPIRFPNTNWVNYIMKNHTFMSQHNINISGGTTKLRYFISGGMLTEGGLFKEFDESYDNDYRYKRFNYRANIDLDISPTTTLSVDLSGMTDIAKKPYTGQGASGMIKNIYYATPFSSPGIVDGKYIINSASRTDNADGQVLPFTGGTGMAYYGSGFMNTSNNKMSIDLLLNQKLDFVTKGLSWRIKGSYNSDMSLYKQGNASVANYTPVYQEDGTFKAYRKNGDTTEPSYSISYGKARDWYFETALNYNRSFGLHSISVLALYNQSKGYYPKSYEDIPHGYVGFVGRTTYDYADRYIAEFDAGYNGSENFAPGRRYGFFPAGSVGWVASDENFFKPLKKVVSFIKLRASWGLVGNDVIDNGKSRFYYTPDPYAVNQSALFNRTGKDGGAYGYNFGVENGTTKYGAIELLKHNPEVTWEKAFKQDYGADINFLDDRLRTTIDFYHEHRKSIFVSDNNIPAYLGFTPPRANLGSTSSWGYEFSLSWNDKIGNDFRYWGKFNLSLNRNKILEKKEATQLNNYEYEKGHRIGSRFQYKFWKYYYKGAEEDYEKEFGTPFPQQLTANLKPGDAVYVDLDKNGRITGDDMSYAFGHTDDPEYIAGLNFGFQWKGLSFNAQFTGAWKVTRMLTDVFRQPFYSSSTTTQGGLLLYHYKYTWTENNPSQSAEYPRASWDNATQNYVNSTLYEKDAKYLRLKTLMFAYDFKFPFMKTLGLTQLQLSLSGYNLFTITPYKWGDPEARASNAPSYPLEKTYTASLKVGF